MRDLAYRLYPLEGREAFAGGQGPNPAVVVVRREPDRHDGQRAHRFASPIKITDRPIEHFVIVHARAEHDLGVDGHSSLPQSIQVLVDFGGPRVYQHTQPRVRISGVDAHEQWREPLFDDALPV